MNYSKIFRVLIVILIIAAIGVGIYYFWNWINAKGGVLGLINQGPTPTTSVIETTTESTTTASTVTTNETEAQNPETITQKLSILINSPVFGYWLNNKDNSIYFANLNGQLIKISPTGSRTMISNQALTNLHEISFSADGSWALAEFNYPQKPVLSIFSVASSSWNPLANGTISAGFSPDSKKIIFSDSAALKTMDLATKKITEIQKMSQVGLKLNWVQENTLLLNTDPSIESNGRLYVFDIKNKTIKTIINGEFGLDINWSANASLGIKLSNTERVPKLTLIDNLGITLANFPFITIPEKCLIESSKLYCGIPKNIPQGSVFPDDYYKNKVYFVDDIYEIDLSTNKTTKLFDGNEIAIDAYNLKLKDNALLFINKYDNKVYSLNLQ